MREWRTDVKKHMTFRVLTAVGVMLAVAGAAQAAMIPNAIPVVAVEGHDQSDGASPGNGSVSRVVSGAGLTIGDVNNTATWTHDTSWQNDWQGNFDRPNLPNGAADGWMAMDFGSSKSNLDTMYVWNVNEGGTGGSQKDRGVNSFDLWYTNSPTTPVPPTTATSTAYDFAAAGWTPFTTDIAVAQGGDGAIHATVDVSGIPSARYIGLDFDGNYGSGFRVGLAEVQISEVPPPVPVMSVSPTAPTVDGADIAQLDGLTDPGGDQGHFWDNRPNHGQTFTTGPNAAGYTLSAVSLLARVDQGSTTSPTWDIRIGTVDGSNVFTPVQAETATGVTIPQAYNGGSAPPPPQWVTWTLGTPTVLAPNTLYGFDLHPSGGGFISLNNPGDVYGGGTAISSGDNYPASPPNALRVWGFDRVFHVDLAPAGAVIPEPMTMLAVGLGISGLGGYIRKRRRA